MQNLNQRRPYRVARQQVDEVKNTYFTVTNDKKNSYILFGIGLLALVFVKGIIIGLLVSSKE